MENYVKILNMCISDDVLRDFMLKPFLVQGTDKVCSTDGHIITFFSYEKVKDTLKDELIYCDATLLNAVRNYISMPHIMGKNISVDFLKENFKKIPIIDEVIVETEIGDCEECLGHGYVKWTYQSNDCSGYELESDCPICNGSGEYENKIKVNTGKMVHDYDNYYIKIGECKFHSERIKKLIDIADLVCAENISLVNQSCNPIVNLFTINDVSVILTPNYSANDEDVFLTIV